MEWEAHIPLGLHDKHVGQLSSHIYPTCIFPAFQAYANFTGRRLTKPTVYSTERRAVCTRSLLQNTPCCRLQPASFLNEKHDEPFQPRHPYLSLSNFTSTLPTQVSIQHGNIFSPRGDASPMPQWMIHTPRCSLLCIIMRCANVTSTPTLEHTRTPHELLSSFTQYFRGYLEIESVLLLAQEKSSTERRYHVNMPRMTC